MLIKSIIERKNSIKYIETLTGRKLLKYEKRMWGKIWKKKAKGQKIIINI